MRTWICSCGSRESFGTDSPQLCQTCENCGTTLLRDAEGKYLPAISHDIKLRFSQVTGEPKYNICIRCLKRFPLEQTQSN